MSGEHPAGAAQAALFLAVWLGMMAAMMLPSASPMLLAYRRVARSTGGTAFFGAGYLACWTAAGGLAYGAYALAEGRLLAMHELHPLERGAQAAALGAAAVWQLSPIKDVCLRRCRSPFDFVLHHWREGRSGALRMGIVHGAWCIGCCAGLMLMLFALGVMSVGLMAALAVVVLIEKAAPFGVAFGRAAGGALAVLALGVAVA